MADNIKQIGEHVYHKSAGGFVFYEEPRTHELFVALIRPQKEDGLFVPKGHIKTSEKPIEAAKREICEELSICQQLDLVSELGVEKYSFTMDDSGILHHKEVFLYVFSCSEKFSVKARSEENIEEAGWFSFYDGLRKMTYDRDSLLKARQLFYFNKKNKRFYSG